MAKGMELWFGGASINGHCTACGACSQCGRIAVNTMSLGCDHCFCEETYGTGFSFTEKDHMKCCMCATKRAKTLIKEDLVNA